MNRLVGNEIYFGRDVPLDELARKIDKVTNEAQTSFRGDRMAMMLLGDLKGRKFVARLFRPQVTKRPATLESPPAVATRAASE